VRLVVLDTQKTTAAHTAFSIFLQLCPFWLGAALLLSGTIVWAVFQFRGLSDAQQLYNVLNSSPKGQLDVLLAWTRANVVLYALAITLAAGAALERTANHIFGECHLAALYGLGVAQRQHFRLRVVTLAVQQRPPLQVNGCCALAAVTACIWVDCC
jgi:hypothetical protein